MFSKLFLRMLLGCVCLAGQSAEAANSCLFELHTEGEANVTVNLRHVSAYSVERQDGGWRITIDLKSGKTHHLHLWTEPGAKSVQEFERAAKRCMS